MELKEYIKIIKQNKLLFFGLWLAVVFLSLVWLKTRPDTFQTALSVEISRDSSIETQDYQYDQYYRLEADNKFADNVVQWLKDPAFVNAVYSQAGLNPEKMSLRQLARAFTAEKLSANYIQVKLTTSDAPSGQKMTTSMERLLNLKAENLNRETQSKNWFKLVYGSPITTQEQYSLAMVLIVAVGGGLLISIIASLFRYYWQE